MHRSNGDFPRLAAQSADAEWEHSESSSSSLSKQSSTLQLPLSGSEWLGSSLAETDMGEVSGCSSIHSPAANAEADTVMVF
mmetsp:Transcript_37048/g.81392  ORF Transcript_37048/g.81392 Transcript_37048/m.81392 type:complete len:81 (-) Transcript_37048:259-501(-)